MMFAFSTSTRSDGFLRIPETPHSQTQTPSILPLLSRERVVGLHRVLFLERGMRTLAPFPAADYILSAARIYKMLGSTTFACMTFERGSGRRNGATRGMLARIGRSLLLPNGGCEIRRRRLRRIEQRGWGRWGRGLVRTRGRQRRSSRLPKALCICLIRQRLQTISRMISTCTVITT